MKRITSYHEARLYAEHRANESQLPVAIRHVKEYGKNGYNISFAAVNDSDFVRAEIVYPTTLEVK